MPLSHTVDEARRRLTLTFSGTVSPRLFGEYVVGLYRSRPELFEYDCITDLLAYEGDLSNADLQPLIELYGTHVRPGSGPKRSYVVTRDPKFGLWAAALNALFPGRIHSVVNTLAEANARLDGSAEHAQRPSATA